MYYMDAPFTYYVKCKIYDTLMDLTDRSACTVHRASSAKRAHRADAYETNMVCTGWTVNDAVSWCMIPWNHALFSLFSSLYNN